MLVTASEAIRRYLFSVTSSPPGPQPAWRAEQALSQCIICSHRLPLSGSLLLIQHALLKQEGSTQDQETRGHGYLKTTQAAFEVRKRIGQIQRFYIIGKAKISIWHLEFAERTKVFWRDCVLFWTHTLKFLSPDLKPWAQIPNPWHQSRPYFVDPHGIL